MAFMVFKAGYPDNSVGPFPDATLYWIPVLNVEGVCALPQKYKTIDDAFEATLTATHHRLVKVVEFDDPDWKRRERVRLKYEYMAVPWADKSWSKSGDAELHFPHVAAGDTTKIAFTENEKKGRQDIQLRMKPGRYLKRFFGAILSGDEIESWAQKWAALEQVEIKFAKTADEIEEVYCNGPHSCMAYSPEEFSSKCHPVRVYGDSDLQVAYMIRDERITARVLVWPEKKKYSVVYGDKGRLVPKLEELGYTSGCLEGARIRKISDGSSFVMPYIDELYSVSDCDGDWFSLGGGISADNTNGLSDYGRPCDNCGDNYDDDDEGGYVDSRDESWCPSCYENTFYCSYTHEQIADADGIELDDGELVSERHFECEGWTCEISGGLFIGYECQVLTECGSVVHEREIGDEVYMCAHDTGYYMKSAMVEVEDDVWVASDNLDDYRADNPELLEAA